MTYSESASEVFWRALKSLPEKERRGVVTRMLKDKDFMEDMVGVIVEQCGKESSRRGE